MRSLALACVLLMAAVVVASAWLRLAQWRADCVDWPGCRDAARPVLAGAAPAGLGDATVLAAVRATHRVVASTVLVLVIALAALALARRPRAPAFGRHVLAMLALALGLAALGIVTPGARSAAVMLGNLLGGLLLLALAWSSWRTSRGAPAPPPALAAWALGGATLWLLQAALGALSGAGVGAVAPVAHLATAVVAAGLAAAVGLAAVRCGCVAEGRALIAVAGAQLLLGAASAAWGAAPAIVLAHNATAAAGGALLLGLALARRR